MSNIYFRRWTRMYITPANKYFKMYDVIPKGMEQFRHFQNAQNPFPENKRFYKRMLINHQEEINNKLIKNLFIRYPDLKYESINRQKYHGDNFNSYSFSHAFITQQKKLMKAGYSMSKAFQLVEAKFQQKMKRKLDQTLMSKGLAIGNRARSLLSIYQQQVEYESRLKMLRTRRQVIKFENQLKQVEEAVNKAEQYQQQGQENQNEPNYQRIFSKITQQTGQKLNQPTSQQKRGDLINSIDKEFRSTFGQFYEIAAYKDRLKGLTDDQIKQEIMTSPSKIKKLSAQIIKFVSQKGEISLDEKGEIKFDQKINQNIKNFINQSPTVKIAILNHLLNYENPSVEQRNRTKKQAIQKLKFLRSMDTPDPNMQKKNQIKENKLKQMEQVIFKDFPEDKRAYRLLQSTEERMLRLQIKYLQSYINNQKAENETAYFEKLKDAIQRFRRLKFRMEKRHKYAADGEIVFPQHHEFKQKMNNIEDQNIEYEDLIEYLRKKSQQRRLKAIDQIDDNKINELIKKQACNEIPKSEGDQPHQRN